MEVSAKTIFNNIVSSIAVYSPEEKRAITFIILEKTLGITRSQILSGTTVQPVNEAISRDIDHIVQEVNRYRPIQYIFNEAYFFGYRFYVNSHVLIPRPETEELVDKILKDIGPIKNLSIADWCTGSGCIAISLAAALPLAQISGWDISTEALAVAVRNAEQNDVSVSWMLTDILSPEISEETHKYDIIVSNPPYVTEMEKMDMSENVLMYEPHLALFVPNNDPLLFYAAIAERAVQMLNEGGKLYLEINEQFGEGMKLLLEGFGFLEVEITKDMSGKDRFAVGMKN